LEEQRVVLLARPEQLPMGQQGERSAIAPEFLLAPLWQPKPPLMEQQQEQLGTGREFFLAPNVARNPIAGPQKNHLLRKMLSVATLWESRLVVV
jgi:hypothetical protein